VAVKLLKKNHHKIDKKKISFLDNLYSKIIHILLDSKKSAIKFLSVIALLLLVSVSLVYLKIVKVKMLPFDNKTEFQIALDYQPSTSLQKNHELTKLLAQELIANPEILKVQIFSGEPAPVSFSGMVKHNYLRRQDYMSDLQIVLTNKDDRKISSHQIIENIRPIIKKFADENQAIAKVLEIPPGPPVLGTIVAEIYAKNQQERDKISAEIVEIFKKEPSIVDLDSSLRKTRQRQIYEFDYERGGALAVSANQVALSGKLLFSENKIGSLGDVSSPEEVDVNFVFPKEIRGEKEALSTIKISALQSGNISAGDVLQNPQIVDAEILNRKNLVPLNYVTAELAGDEEAPVYAIAKLQKNMQNYDTRFMNLPWQFENPVIKWDGEMFITLEVFRDLGIAFIFAIIGIYILIIIKFKSFSVPIIIMAPIPISLIGIFFGHAILGSYFTAPSMIGFMAGAGIIVRNSIILIDFIEQQIARGFKLKEAVISAGILRFRPMLLTASAVIFGSLVMLSDSIFNGFAISLIFGEIAATLLSRFVIPILYFYLIGKRREKSIMASSHDL
jgi:multidrug efflux pump subunit AcrB